MATIDTSVLTGFLLNGKDRIDSSKIFDQGVNPVMTRMLTSIKNEPVKNPDGTLKTGANGAIEYKDADPINNEHILKNNKLGKLVVAQISTLTRHDISLPDGRIFSYLTTPQGAFKTIGFGVKKDGVVFYPELLSGSSPDIYLQEPLFDMAKCGEVIKKLTSQDVIQTAEREELIRFYTLYKNKEIEYTAFVDKLVVILMSKQDKMMQHLISAAVGDSFYNNYMVNGKYKELTKQQLQGVSLQAYGDNSLSTAERAELQTMFPKVVYGINNTYVSVDEVGQVHVTVADQIPLKKEVEIYKLLKNNEEFSLLAKISYNLKNLYETRYKTPAENEDARQRAIAQLNKIFDSGSAYKSINSIAAIFNSVNISSLKTNSQLANSLVNPIALKLTISRKAIAQKVLVDNILPSKLFVQSENDGYRMGVFSSGNNYEDFQHNSYQTSDKEYVERYMQTTTIPRLSKISTQSATIDKVDLVSVPLYMTLKATNKETGEARILGTTVNHKAGASFLKDEARIASVLNAIMRGTMRDAEGKDYPMTIKQVRALLGDGIGKIDGLNKISTEIGTKQSRAFVKDFIKEYLDSLSDQLMTPDTEENAKAKVDEISNRTKENTLIKQLCTFAFAAKNDILRNRTSILYDKPAVKEAVDTVLGHVRDGKTIKDGIELLGDLKSLESVFGGKDVKAALRLMAITKIKQEDIAKNVEESLGNEKFYVSYTQNGSEKIKNGAIGDARAIAEAIRDGYRCSLPVRNNQPVLPFSVTIQEAPESSILEEIDAIVKARTWAPEATDAGKTLDDYQAPKANALEAALFGDLAVENSAPAPEPVPVTEISTQPVEDNIGDTVDYSQEDADMQEIADILGEDGMSLMDDIDIEFDDETITFDAEALKRATEEQQSSLFDNPSASKPK